MTKNLVKKIQNNIFQQSLFERGSKIILGVSGGPDSVCLLDIFAKLQKKYELQLAIAHVNYGLRGKESDKDEKFVRELGDELGIGVEVFPKAKISEILKLRFRKQPSENTLRDIRYDFFEKFRKENRFDYIAVAHNMDDQAETFLMRVIRGAGLQGLSGMKFKTGKIIRPLLNVSREEILQYLDRTKRTHRTDKTNLESRFFRNKVRNELIPYLEKNFNPKIKETIFNSGKAISEDLDMIEKIVKKESKKAEDGNALSVKRLLALHPALQRRILLKKITEQKGGLKNIESAHIEEILKALRSTKGKSQVVVFKGLKLTRKGDRVIISI